MSTRPHPPTPATGPALRVTGLDHIVLVATDVERTVAFYRDVLGLADERLEEWRAGKVPFPSLRIDAGTIIDVFPGKPGRPAGAGNLDHLCLTVRTDDLAALAASLRDRGVTVHGDPVTRWGARGDGTSIYLDDPDGTVVELRTYP